jgi:hypothetical protein
MKLSRFVVPVALGLICLSANACDAHADLLTFFDFNTSSFNSSAGPRSSTLTNNFSIDGLAINSGGTTVNADPDDGGPFPTSAAGNRLDLFNTNDNGNISNAGKYIQFGVDTRGYNNVIVDFATAQGTAANYNAGFNNNQFQYSTNGTTFTNFNATYNPGSAFATQTFNLSGISGLNNNANAAFRIVFNGGPTADNFAANLIDNLAVNAVATPEPSTYAMMALGLVALCVLGAKRKKDGQAI